ncbi:hypothetical protein QFC21_004485 [Naganishia friedmannii]|uniref:Uncharacterized protein n=1 Tax=Naganishia friedmannii TaxID=89922 RepID=A0ACC2VHR5_9TREE|nr:hypothetical protein QFC21_004485 [Naganishia friedmannii]
MTPSETFRGRGGGRGARGGRGGRGGSGAGRGRGGFKVGPSHAPSNAYLGKAKKIKQDLIDRARIKKSFAKTLKKEGLTSERLGSSTNALALGARANPYGQPKDSDMENDRSDGRRRTARAGNASDNDDDDDDLSLESDESMHSGDDQSMGSEDKDENDDFEEDKTLAEHRRRMKGKGREQGHEEPSIAATQDQRVDDRPSRWKQAPANNRFASGSNGSALSARGSVNARSQDQPRRENTKGPSRQQYPAVAPPTQATREEAEAIRELKRQAYLGPRSSLSADVHPSRTRKQHQQQEKEGHRDTAPASSPAGASKPEKNVNAKNVPTARPVAIGKAPVRAPASAVAAGTRRDGRPNLNARMGLLLEQIQRSK